MTGEILQSEGRGEDVYILNENGEVVYEGESAPEVLGQFTGYTRIRLIEKHRQAHGRTGSKGRGKGGGVREIRDEENDDYDTKDSDEIGEGTVRLDDTGAIIEGHVEAVSPKNSSNNRVKKEFRRTHSNIEGEGVITCDESGVVQPQDGIVVVSPDGSCAIQGGDIKILTHDDVSKVVARQKLFAKKRMQRHQKGRVISVDNRNKIIIETVFAVSDAGEISIETREERKARAYQKFEQIVASRRCPSRNVNGKAYVVGEEGTIVDEVDQDLLMDSDCVEDAEGRAGESAAVN